VLLCLWLECLIHVCGRPYGLGFWGRRREASKAKPKQVRFAEKPNNNDDIPVRRSGRRLYLGGQAAIKDPGTDPLEKRGEENRKMSSLRGSSSEATNTNDEDIATGILNLAIACRHVERQSTRFDRAAGKETLHSSPVGFRVWVGQCICFQLSKFWVMLG
jgi:hypothetical protein